MTCKQGQVECPQNCQFERGLRLEMRLQMPYAIEMVYSLRIEMASDELLI
jgi:hypothetical protein